MSIAQTVAGSTKQQLADRVKHARLERKWSRPVLAQRSGVNQYTLKRFERSGDICLNDFIALVHTLDALPPLTSLLKPRISIDMDSWSVHLPSMPQRGRRSQQKDLELVAE